MVMLTKYITMLQSLAVSPKKRPGRKAYLSQSTPGEEGMKEKMQEEPERQKDRRKEFKKILALKEYICALAISQDEKRTIITEMFGIFIKQVSEDARNRSLLSEVVSAEQRRAGGMPLDMEQMPYESIRRTISRLVRAYEFDHRIPAVPLYIKSAFLSKITHYLEEKRTSKPSSIVMLDSKDFKQINDDIRLGHHVGDEVLRIIASIIRLTVCQDTNPEHDDIAARWPTRYGGDEFCYHADLPQAESLLLAEEIAYQIAHYPWSHLGIKTVTANIGVANLISENGGKKPSLVAQLLIRAADKLMYKAKRKSKISPEGIIPKPQSECYALGENDELIPIAPANEPKQTCLPFPSLYLSSVIHSAPTPSWDST